jgi:myo-inositol 2-dehydrogenase/D-chiro-inositol 1-dehydrogenase
MMIHDFDVARFLLGEDPVSLHANGSCLVDPAIGAAGDYDTAAVTLQNASGKICQISNSRRASYGYDQRIEVHGSKGMLRADNLLNSSVKLLTKVAFGVPRLWTFFLERYEAAYARELAHFVASLKFGTEPSPNGLDGLKAQLMADAAASSCKEGSVMSLHIG